MFVHGENSTFFRLLTDPDTDPGKDAGDSSGVPRGRSFRSFEPLTLLSVCLHSMSSLREAFVREVVVGGLGGSTLNPVDIVGKGGERRRAYSYTSVGQDIGRKHNTLNASTLQNRTKKERKCGRSMLTTGTTTRSFLLNAVSRVNQKNANVKASALPGANVCGLAPPRNGQVVRVVLANPNS
jgi:hypothetical protein